MQTFLTPEPITIEIRNSAGSVQVDLADVTTSTIDVVPGPSHPLGFLDDVIRAAKAQFAGARSGGADSAPSGYREDRPLDDPTERVRVDLRQHGDGGESTTLIVDTDPARDGWKSAFTVHITAPAGSGVRVQTQSAGTVTTGIAGRVEVRTASGDVRLDQVLGRSVVQTASGDVTIADTAECDIRTASGDIELRRVRSEAQLHSTSGDIRVDGAGDDLSARSVSGDVRVADAVSGRVELITVSGDVEVGVHAGTLAAIDLSTVSGTTHNDFVVSDEPPARPDSAADGVVDAVVDAMVNPDTEAETGSADAGSGRPLDGAVGADEPVLELRVKTTSGDVRLRRAEAG
ncbi:DUF4097 family beta strand repeat-containing protein [Nakamurella sp.]|uniref:DUF4097 family beta strand repeat-containing protein n=1 Tax=Nakamurella sp. TaxID=1869182 RepID=UPI003782F4C7